MPVTVSRKYVGLMCRGKALVLSPAGVDKRSAAFEARDNPRTRGREPPKAPEAPSGIGGQVLGILRRTPPVQPRQARGGAAVRPSTGTPTVRKNSSCPAGEHTHSSRAGRSEALANECGALAGMLTVSLARTVDFSPRKVTSTSPSRTVNISSKSWRWGGGPPPGGVYISIRPYRPAGSLPSRRMGVGGPTQPRGGGVLVFFGGAIWGFRWGGT